MLTLVLLLQTAAAAPLAVRADTIHPVHDALHYDITLVPSDSGRHVLSEVQTSWRLRSAEPVEMELDALAGQLRLAERIVGGRHELARVARAASDRDTDRRGEVR